MQKIKMRKLYKIYLFMFTILEIFTNISAFKEWWKNSNVNYLFSN
jgi:hypothetical protein